MILGIDPGLTGGICAVDRDRRVLILEPMPETAKVVDSQDLARLLRRADELPMQPPDVFLEQVSARPGQGSVSTFKFGRVYGAVEGVVGALGFPLHLVRPQAWQKVSHAGTPGNADPKERSVLAASRLYPSVDLVRGTTTTRERASQPHLGLVDALLIAHFGWVTLYGGTHGN